MTAFFLIDMSVVLLEGSYPLKLKVLNHLRCRCHQHLHLALIATMPKDADEGCAPIALELLRLLVAFHSAP